MTHNPTTWHTRPAARALIGVIATCGIEPQTRNTTDLIGSIGEVRYYDCEEYNELAAMQQQALDAALKAAWAAPNMACHTRDNPAYADFYALVRQDLAALVAGEIAALRMGEAA